MTLNNSKIDLKCKINLNSKIFLSLNMSSHTIRMLKKHLSETLFIIELINIKSNLLMVGNYVNNDFLYLLLKFSDFFSPLSYQKLKKIKIKFRIKIKISKRKGTKN
jgi:hypothetical protein